MILKDVCFHLVSEGGEQVRGLHPRGRQDGGVALNCRVQKIRCLPPQAAVFLPCLLFPPSPPRCQWCFVYSEHSIKRLNISQDREYELIFILKVVNIVSSR
ncbi:hypothetical protein KIL84_005551 [Mauremys mutica]|uniref:Uncharacterized protein n=1 Tax=Mauremys mutica TaxID=74926 RepID=A0A9D3WQ11_9SAUR|nr:hypothetical protein KIL84_005551 [Mauremys mutica]